MDADPIRDQLNEIWQEIHSLLVSDAYFHLWVNAQELVNIPSGPIAQIMTNNYVSYQLAAIRRICDRGHKDDVISLPKLLDAIKENQPHKADFIISVEQTLKTESKRAYGLATQYIAHNANPSKTTNWKEWSFTYDLLASNHKVISKIALAFERDLLGVTYRAMLIPVYQDDILAEFRPYVPVNLLAELRLFWDEHCAVVNGWAQHGWRNV